MKTNIRCRSARLFLAAACLTLLCLHAGADQFVEVTNPGWTNSSQYSCTGAWGDYDGDGFIDLFVPNTTASWTGWTNFLYHNNGNGTFTRQFADQVGPVASDKDASDGGYWGDVNNDGLLDLLVLNCLATAESPPITNRLYLNQGNGTFRSWDAGDLTNPDYTYAWGGLVDYDNDGFLDAFLCAAWVDSGHRTNLLFHGHGDGTFSLVTDGVVATDEVSSSSSNDAAWGDYDNDGDMDLIVANAFGERDFFYRNDGHGQFTRLTDSILESPGYQSWHHAWGDYDNDGLQDVALGAADGTRLFRNNGTGDFEETASWFDADRACPVWADYDNDGYLDLLITRGQDTAKQLMLYHNNGDGTFTQVADVLTRPSAKWLGGAWGDYDNDGFLDLFVAETTGKNALYHNLGSSNQWLKLRLEGTVANRSAIGAKVRAKATIGGKTVWQMREVSGGNYCQNDLRPNFGLGDAAKVDLVRIEWPSGAVQEFADVAANQMLTITEPARVEMTQGGELKIKCWQGQAFDVQTSPDLSAWTVVATVTNTTGTLTFTDPQAGGARQRFYRVLTR
jgi:enediyne biosynthesis protein E4